MRFIANMTAYLLRYCTIRGSIATKGELMGLYNTLVADILCPGCSSTITVEAQFKYGNVREMRIYAVGESLNWGLIQYGKPGAKRVVVSAELDPCPSCHRELEDYVVVIVQDRIEGLVGPTQAYDFAGQNAYFLVLEAE